MKDTKVFHSEECITEHKPLVCDFKIRKVKDTKETLFLRTRYGSCMKEQCIGNDGVLAVRDEDMKIALKSYHEKLLNTEFVSDKNTLS